MDLMECHKSRKRKKQMETNHILHYSCNNIKKIVTNMFFFEKRIVTNMFHTNYATIRFSMQIVPSMLS